LPSSRSGGASGHGIEQLDDFFQAGVVGLFVADRDAHADHGAIAKGHHDAPADEFLAGECVRDGVGKRQTQRDGERDIAIQRHG
jgi:hypothetical protein